MFTFPFLVSPDFCLFAQRSVPKKSSGTIDMYSVIMIILGVAVIAVVVAVAYYIGSHLRKSALERDKPPKMSDYLVTFREATDEGKMTAVEFAAVKKHLAGKIMDEVKQDNSRNEPNDDSPLFIPK